MEDKQKLIDELKYPPTHQYNLKKLKPKGSLVERFEILKKHFPNFFVKEGNFLDIGCNKGFFSLYGHQFFKHVTGIDFDKRFIDLCNKLKPDNTLVFHHTGFRNFIPKIKYNRVFIGNAHHYIFKECHGWDWIAKLAALTEVGAKVLIEGPVDMNCQDMWSCIPDALKDSFTENEFFNNMEKYFKRIKIVPTTHYTPDRYFILFERKLLPMDNIYLLKDLPIHRMIKDRIKECYSQVYESKNELICKVYDEKYFHEEDEIRIKLASLSPISNGIIGLVRSNCKIVGWVEKKLKGQIFHYFEMELEIFKEYCWHQIFLAQNNYFDFDAATINYIRLNNESLKDQKKLIVNFDKCLVHPINRVRLYHYKDIKNSNDFTGVYFKMIKNSYCMLKDEWLEIIRKAMATKDSFKIENAFYDVLFEMSDINRGIYHSTTTSG